MPRRTSPASSAASHFRATSWCVSAPATSRSGPMRCPASWRHRARWRDASGLWHDGAMTFPNIVADLKSRVPGLRGRLLPNEPLAPLTWFRVGGPAQALFMPEDEADLAALPAQLAADI